MTLPETPTPPAVERIHPLYKVGLVLVIVINVALAAVSAYIRYDKLPNHTPLDDVTETVAYAGCSLVCPLFVVAGVALFIARAGNRRFGPLLMKMVVWFGLTLVPLFLLFRVLSAAARGY